MNRRVSLVVFVLALVGGAVPASAQSFGLRAGASGSPDQFYVGAHMETRPIAERVTFRPNLEVGVGDQVTTVAGNLEFVYRHELPSSPWTMLVGGGPAANFYSFDTVLGDDSDFGGGVNLLLGIEHRRGIFAEVKVGLIDSPNIKVGVGFNFGR